MDGGGVAFGSEGGSRIAAPGVLVTALPQGVKGEEHEREVRRSSSPPKRSDTPWGEAGPP